MAIRIKNVSLEHNYGSMGMPGCYPSPLYPTPSPEEQVVVQIMDDEGRVTLTLRRDVEEAENFVVGDEVFIQLVMVP